ncbi:MAG TPA: serine hydrolase domain-containing protein [Caulobacteraceae bacterium]|jgi:CubicO group peptidase (beta-lactamase class C family)
MRRSSPNRRLNRLAAAAATAVCVAALSGGVSKATAPPLASSDAEIDRILAERIDFYQRGVGMVLGVVGPDGRRIVVHGVRDAHDRRPLDGDTLFEIGSVTKAFVGLLLENMVRQEDVTLSEPVNQLLPPGMQTPAQNGRTITLLDLATHTSGLPGEPENLRPSDPDNPFATYSPAQFGAFMSSFTYPWPIGSRFGYSNIGYGLLGYSLGRAGGSDLPALVQARITRPLGMASTSFDLPAGLQPRLARGHDIGLKPTEPWGHSPLFQGSGGLYSSANDLLTFLSAAMGLTDTPLAPDFKAMLAIRRAGGISDLFASVGWTVLERDGLDIIYKAGSTGGYDSWIGFDPARRIGIVVLSNTGDSDVSDIGWHLLDPHYPLASLHRPVAVAQAVLDGEAGRYKTPGGEILSIARDGDHLTWSLPGGAPNPVSPASKRLFFAKASETELTFDFEAESQSSPSRVVLFRGQGPEVCERISQ